MSSLSLPTYLKIVRASAVYDVLLTAPFATPWSFAFLHVQMSAINVMLGGAALPAFGPFQVMIACMMGSVVLIWSLLRILEPTVRLGRFDGITRFLFATWMAWALMATGAPMLWLFVIPEFAWGVAQWWPLATPDLVRIEVEHLKAERWDGKLPENIYAGAPIPFFNVGKQQ